ncbi:MAG: cofactor-independent phosphoglycerate mutase [Clostridia bacterium]|nr:cofactor-independent phosphoglycerate mutase [Clostridia bacterium]
MKEKIVVILGDGMADLPDENGDTPMSLANKPYADALAKTSEIGLCRTVPEGMKPGSDTANLSVIGYDPADCYTGRSPLEAVSMGITLGNTDVTFRANLVTLEDGKMIDYSAGEITTAEAEKLIEYLSPRLGFDGFELCAGVSYRHCLVRRNHAKSGATLTPPHDITGKDYAPYLPSGCDCAILRDIMERSEKLLKDHPVNLARRARGEREATSLWLWGEGTKPKLDDFRKKYGLNGTMISAVDLLKGIALCAGMRSVDVEGATGTLSTNFEGKARAAVKALEEGSDYVYVHLEAPDECGHQGDRSGKTRSIELIDEKIIAPIDRYLKSSGAHYRLAFLPDHPTPTSTRTHSGDPVPYMIYDSEEKKTGAEKFDEFSAKKSGNFIEKGCLLTRKLCFGK